MEPLNWTAIIVGTLVAFFVGWLYYSPKVLGHTWALGSRIDPNPPAKMPVMAMSLQIVALFLLAIVIGLTAQIEALGTAIAAILAAATLVMAQDAFSEKNKAAVLIDGGFIVLAGIIMIVCQGIF
ncbi:hypothetical protein NBRC116601_09950 [Cognatishimia sp. WU-CL00825]|uniref:DUF1761 domain-containing protein n=1 Tax=Cognatishimia sp. WU-CL00825 TaxID=3127658 RepID=UPI0031023A90